MKQHIFERLNIAKNGEFDEDAGITYIQNHLKDNPEWQEVAAKGIKECHKGISPHIDGIQGTTNFTKEECNMKYHIMTHCLDIHGFTVSSFVSCHLKSYYIIFKNIALPSKRSFRSS
jgi:hypothetical protein